MVQKKELRADLLKFLKDGCNEHPSKIIKGEELMNKFFINGKI
jgi:hypothetical protein